MAEQLSLFDIRICVDCSACFIPEDEYQDMCESCCQKEEDEFLAAGGYDFMNPDED